MSWRLQASDIGGGKGVLAGGGGDQAGVAGLVVVSVDPVTNAEGGIPVVVHDDLLGVIWVHQDLDVDPAGSGLEHDVGQQLAVAGVLGHQLSIGWSSGPNEKGPFGGGGDAGVAGGEDHLGHIKPDGKDCGVQRPTGRSHFLLGKARLHRVLPASKVGIGVRGHFRGARTSHRYWAHRCGEAKLWNGHTLFFGTQWPVQSAQQK